MINGTMKISFAKSANEISILSGLQIGRNSFRFIDLPEFYLPIPRASFYFFAR